MPITYSNTPGTHFESHLVSEVCINQTDQIGNNTVVVTDDIVTSENGQIGDGTWGIGASYVGRLIVINKGTAGVQIRRCIAEVAISTPTVANSWLLTVHEDWDINPIETTDQLDIPYETADANDSDASGGVGFTTRTGYFTWSNDVTIDSGAGLQILDGTAWELDDNTGAATFVNSSGGYFYSGYQAGEEYINGGQILTVNNDTGEPIYDFQSGSLGYVFDALFWAQLVDSDAYHTGDMEFYGCKWLNSTDELTLYGAKIVDGKGYGKGAITSIVRVDANTVIDGMVVSTVHALDSAADTAVETLSNLERITFSNTTNILSVRQNKTWYLIDPNWGVITYTDLDWVGTATGNAVYDQRSIKVIVQEADGTRLQNALINVYEDTILADLVLEITTDVDGYSEGAFSYKLHVTNSATTTYGGHALQAGKWLYLPFVAAQESTSKFLGAIVLSLDDNIAQTIQATALTAGSGITWNDETNSSSIIKYTGGAGTLAVGNTVTGGTSGANGIVTQIISGDSVAGTVHLKTRDGISFSGTETLSDGAGWTANLTSGSEQRFSVWIDAVTKSYQTLYDYIAAVTTETTLSAAGEIIWEWCRSVQAQALYATGTSFFAESSNGKGIIIVNGSGTIDYFTDDSDVQYVPPSTVTLNINVVSNDSPIELAQTSIHLLDSPYTALMNEDTTALGIATEQYDYVGNVDVVVKVRKSEITDNPRYFPESQIAEITASGLNLTVALEINDFLS